MTADGGYRVRFSHVFIVALLSGVLAIAWHDGWLSRERRRVQPVDDSIADGEPVWTRSAYAGAGIEVSLWSSQPWSSALGPGPASRISVEAESWSRHGERLVILDAEGRLVAEWSWMGGADEALTAWEPCGGTERVVEEP